MYEKTAYVVDGVAFVTAIASLAAWLPPIAALFSIVWLSMQMAINWDKFISAPIFKRKI